jgi:ABC-type sugar transport system ATPase subunit
MQNNIPLINVNNIHKRFPGVYALKGINFELYPGEIHALMGENGAGKSTLIKIIAGVFNYEKGNYYIEEEKADINEPIDAIHKGISVIYQELNLVENLSVAENIYFGNLPTTRSGRVLWKELEENTRKALKEVGLNINPRNKVGYLSMAQQQLVEIAKALSHNSRVLIMDEPTSALSPKEIDNLFNLIRELKNKGVGIIYVSHKIEEIFALTDRVTVLRDGEHIGTKRTDELTESTLISMMVGRELSDMFPKTPPVIKEEVLEVRGLTTAKVKDINFEVKSGEIVGFSGLMGSGRTELAKAIFGVDKRLQGSVIVDKREVLPNSTLIAKQLGLGLIPESRKEEGIIPNLSVKNNISIASLNQFKKKFSLNKILETKCVKDIINNLSIKTPSLDQLIVKLSGGNQQKVIVARWLMKENLKVLIIDEPTRGIDVGAKAEIYAILNRLAHEGLAVVMMSSEMPEILSMCDRIYVMKNGQITGQYSREEATQEKLLASAI